MKHKLTIRAAVLLLAALLLLPALIACGDTTPAGTDTTTANADITRNPEEARFPEADYEGADFIAYARSQDAAHYQGFYIVPFEDSADVIDEQAVIRNMRVEARYNVKIKAREAASPHTTLQSDIAAGDVDYQVMLSYRNSMGALALNGAFFNFHNLNCDLTTSWWDKNASEQYDVAGRLFLMPNDVSVSNLAGTRFFFFSKAIVEDYGLKDPYSYAEENNWTLDSFLTLVNSIDNPTSGDNYGTYGLMQEEDYTVFHMLTGAGVPKVERDADGKIVCKVGEDYLDRAQDFFDTFKAVEDKPNKMLSITEAVGYDRRQDVSDDLYYHARQLFTEDHFLFTHTDMEVAIREFKDMKRGFGVIMNPKYNSDQESYYHQMDDNSLIWGIPNAANLDIDMVSNVFDYWAWCSKSTVMEGFFEMTIKNKRASDPTACKMLDIIKDSICYYATDIYNVGDCYTMLLRGYNSSLSSSWSSYKVTIGRQLERIYDKIEVLDE